MVVCLKHLKLNIKESERTSFSLFQHVKIIFINGLYLYNICDILNQDQVSGN